MLASAEERLPIVKEKKPTPKNIHMMLIKSSVSVVAGMSPYPTVAIVCTDQYKDVRYKIESLSS
jgi:hypothetical protein